MDITTVFLVNNWLGSGWLGMAWEQLGLNRKSLGMRLGGNYLGMAWDKGWKWLVMGLGVGRNGLGMRRMYIH